MQLSWTELFQWRTIPTPNRSLSALLLSGTTHTLLIAIQVNNHIEVSYLETLTQHTQVKKHFTYKWLF